MKQKRIDGDPVCCDDPPHACPRRYCSVAMRSFDQAIGMPEPKPKKRKVRDVRK